MNTIVGAITLLNVLQLFYPVFCSLSLCLCDDATKFWRLFSLTMITHKLLTIFSFFKTEKVFSVFFLRQCLCQPRLIKSVNISLAIMTRPAQSMYAFIPACQLQQLRLVSLLENGMVGVISCWNLWLKGHPTHCQQRRDQVFSPV